MDLHVVLDARMSRDLNRVAASTGRTKSSLVREALWRYVTIVRFRAIRNETIPLAQVRGLLTDEDVFRALS